jgi:uncharacterized membrane protein
MEQINAGALVEALPIDLILWGLLGVLIIGFGIYSAVLLWHWKLYSTGKFTTVANMFIYLGVSVGFIVLMVLAATWYTLS